jgi:predicted nuclease of predicted toxin-antitoxin system
VKFILDHCIPISVAAVLRDRGHDVILLSEILPTDSADTIVARVAQINDCILVTQDKDFRKIVTKIPDGVKSKIREIKPNFSGMRIAAMCE